jgi:hypothetical protein
MSHKFYKRNFFDCDTGILTAAEIENGLRVFAVTVSRLVGFTSRKFALQLLFASLTARSGFQGDVKECEKLVLSSVESVSYPVPNFLQ